MAEFGSLVWLIFLVLRVLTGQGIKHGVVYQAEQHKPRVRPSLSSRMAAIPGSQTLPFAALQRHHHQQMAGSVEHHKLMLL